jgi:apolipoprotein N-acyltransferase
MSIAKSLVFTNHSRTLAALNNSTGPRRFRFLIATLSGALLAVSSFQQFHLPSFCWIAPGMILWAAGGLRGKSVFGAGFCAGMAYSLITYYWLLRIPFPLAGVAGWLVLSGLLSVYIAAWCSVCSYLFPGRKHIGESDELAPDFAAGWRAMSPGKRAVWAMLCAAAWVAMEMAAGRLVTDLPLISLAAPQFRLLPLIQVASLTGVYGVSFIVCWFSICAVMAIFSRRQQEKKLRHLWIQIFPPVCVLGCILIYGERRISEPEPTSTRLKIALVQSAFPEQVIWESSEETNRFLKLVELSREALAAKPDLLVWPEAALPEIIGRNRYTQETIGDLVRPAKVWMVMGLNDIRPRAAVSGKFDAFNSAFLIDTNGDLASVYDKSHLMIFGEYMPWWMRRLPFLAKLRRAAEITRGEHRAAFEMNKPRAKFPVSICYEDCFPAEIRKRVDADTDFILNLTNDGWFGESVAQWLHAEAALFRAVENGVPLVRCCNNGLTCWIDGSGRLAYFADAGSVYRPGYKIVEVPLRGEAARGSRTFYNRHGDWFGWGCIGIVGFGLVIRTASRLAGSKP